MQLHEIDECRFDIGVADCVWYLRASTVDECSRWVQAIQSHKQYYQSTNSVDTGTGSVHHGSTSATFVPSVTPSGTGPPPYSDTLRRHESALSLSSITSCRSYKERLSEMETFRHILYQQIKTLQHYFDSSLQSTSLVNEHLKRHRRHQSMNGYLFACLFTDISLLIFID